MNRIIYLDNNATTAVRKEVVTAMEPFFCEKYGNISSTHHIGREAQKAVEDARAKIANFLGTEAVDIVFTSGGTESDNLAIKGVAFANKNKGNHIITSKTEHMAVLETCKFLETQGFEITYLDVDKYGLINPEDLKKAITDKTILVSIMHANNETGTIQPISELAKIVKELNESRTTNDERRIYFHTDAVQTLGKIPVDVEDLGVDLLSISAHKIYGPKGVGALYVRKGTNIIAHQHGGHQERSLRAGTENTPGIVGFAKAIEFLKRNSSRNEKIKILTDKLFCGLKKEIPDARLNGHTEKRLANTLNLSFGSIESEMLLINFDLKGICASSGSACTSGSAEQSHVLKAMKVNAKLAQGAVRFSLGIHNTQDEIDYCLKEIPLIVERLRKTS